jgi:hypothetical protein
MCCEKCKAELARLAGKMESQARLKAEPEEARRLARKESHGKSN